MLRTRFLTSVDSVSFACRVVGTDWLSNVSSFTKRQDISFVRAQSSHTTLSTFQHRRAPFASSAFPVMSDSVMSDSTMSSAFDLKKDEDRFRKVLPVDKNAHKGQGGKVAVIGGSKDYTGAPFFASMAAFRAGAELVYVLAYPQAASVLKTYSPDLIVKTVSEFSVGDSFSEELSQFLDGVHAIVVGPGLGMEDDARAAVLCAISSSHVPLILDADALSLVASDKRCNEAVRKACHDRNVPIVFTPNVPELKRLAKSMDLDQNADAKEIAKNLGPAAVVVAKGSKKRVGGQGDILAGCIAIASAWAIKAHDFTRSDLDYEDFVSCVVMACWIAREASRRAYKARRRGLLASDILPFVSAVVEDIEDAECDR